MKPLLILFFFCSTFNSIQAQPWEKAVVNEPIIFTRTEIAPSFNGGQVSWNTFLEKTLDKDILKTSKIPSGEYNVLVQFIVHKDGSLSGIKAISTHGYGLESEAERIIQETPRWIPAKQNGITVAAYHKQIIKFIAP